MQSYEHTQPGTVIRIILGFTVLIFGAVLLQLTPNARESVIVVFVAVALVVIALIAMFHSLTVTVSSEEIVASLGIGLITKRISMSDVASARVVTNSVWSGWGVRWIEGGWCYTVSGFDAVEITMRKGRSFRIGSDEPDLLLDAILTQL